MGSLLPTELVEFICSKLFFTDTYNFRAVCRAWREAAMHYKFSPLLVLPSEEETQEKTIFFWSLKDKTVKKQCYVPMKIKQVVGSSHGWLVVLDENFDLFCLNPFTHKRIQLPRKESVSYFLEVSESRSKNQYDDTRSYFYQKGLSDCDVNRFLSIEKVVLSAKPSCKSDVFAAVIIYGYRRELGFCRYGDKQWTALQSLNAPYLDAAFSDGHLLLALGASGLVEIWNFWYNYPMKELTLYAPWPEKAIEAENKFEAEKYTSQCYLVPSSEDLILVVRYRGEFVTSDGEVITEADLLTDESTHPLVCPYRTVLLLAFRFDFSKQIWSEAKSLNGCALFVGGNHSASLKVKEHPGCEADSIYFTDDYWDRMNEDYLYGGHDMGIFSVRSGMIGEFNDQDTRRIQPSPVWFLPDCSDNSFKRKRNSLEHDLPTRFCSRFMRAPST